MKELSDNNDDTRDIGATNKESMKNRKLVTTGVATAIIACAVCLVPTGLLVVVSGGVVALVSTWFGYAAVAILIFSSALALGLWQHRARKPESGCCSGT